MGLKWYVARTLPRGEFAAAIELSRDGFEVFSPQVKVPHPRPGHSEIPLFPGYLFIRWDPEIDGWPSFRPGHHITGFVRFDNEVPSLSDEIVGELMERWEAINQQGGLFRQFSRGEKVQVVSGNLQGLAEIVEEAKSPQARAKVLMQFMGRLVQAQVPWDSLRPIEDKQFEIQRAPRRTRGGGRWIRGFGSSALANT